MGATSNNPTSQPSSNQSHDIGQSAIVYTVFSGFCMGTADVVPGVSGGTMAVALGIYHRLLAAIATVGPAALSKAMRLQFREALRLIHLRFLVSLLAGAALGIGLMVKVVKLPELVAATSPHRPLVYAVFFGMVLASTVVLARQINRWPLVRGAALVVGAVVGFAIVTLTPTNTPEHPLFVFFCGVVSICAMLLPGISGSFILLVLGKYAYILDSLDHLRLGVILPFVCGCVVGITAFSRLLKWLLDRWHDTVLVALIGLLFGSLWRIWPYQHLTEIMVHQKSRVVGATPFLPTTFDPSMLGAFLVGVFFVACLEVYAQKRRQAAIA